MADPVESVPRFEERPTEPIVSDAWWLGSLPLAAALVCALAGWWAATAGLVALALFTLFFFRNPSRAVAGGERSVVSPADGRVLEVGEIEEPDGTKALRIGVFLSVFNVHVNRMPLAGRVLAVERSGSRYRAAFDPRAESENVRCTLRLETAEGVRFRVVQISGVIARRIVCHPKVGEYVARGARYGLIRFGSRTDVVLPSAAVPRVRRGERVRGGRSVLATLGETE